jgi:hypothetical protein
MSKRTLARPAKVDLAYDDDAALSGLPKAVACAAKTGARVAAWLNPTLQFGPLRRLDLLRENLLFRRHKTARGRKSGTPAADLRLCESSVRVSALGSGPIKVLAGVRIG